MRDLEDVLEEMVGAGAYAAPLASVLSHLADAGAKAYETHEQSEAAKRQADLQRMSQDSDRAARDYAVDMRRKADEARAKAEMYRRATAGKWTVFDEPYKKLDDAAKILEGLAVSAEERAGLRAQIPTPTASAAQQPYRESWASRHRTALLVAGAAALGAGGLIFYLRRRK